MKIEGTHLFNAPRATVWALLHDPHTVANCLPGCHQITQPAADQFEGDLTFQAGPMRGNFEGRVRFANIKPPNSFTIEAVATGQTGSLHGHGRIQLHEENSQTTLYYSGEAQVEGRVLDAGFRLLETATRAIIRQCLTNLDQEIATRTQPAPPPPPAQFVLDVAKEFVTEAVPPQRRHSLLTILLAALGTTLAALLLFRRRCASANGLSSE